MNVADTAPLALARLDDLMQGLKDEDPDSIEQARHLIIEMAEDSSAAQLWTLLVPVRCLFERQTNINKDV